MKDELEAENEVEQNLDVEKLDVLGYYDEWLGW